MNAIAVVSEVFSRTDTRVFLQESMPCTNLWASGTYLQKIDWSKRLNLRLG